MNQIYLKVEKQKYILYNTGTKEIYSVCTAIFFLQNNGCRYMAEILPIRRKTRSNQSINQSNNQNNGEKHNQLHHKLNLFLIMSLLSMGILFFIINLKRLINKWNKQTITIMNKSQIWWKQLWQFENLKVI